MRTQVTYTHETLNFVINLIDLWNGSPGPPYLPEVAGDTYCVDNTQGECVDSGTCTSCSTFNQADVDHIKSMVKLIICI